jgi:hypothetical protein
MKRMLLLSTLLLAGCASDPIKLVAPEYKVVKIPEDFYNCPITTKFPKAENLTNQQVGSLLLTVQQNNIKCKNSLDNIKRYMEEAEKTISTKK